MRYSQSIQVGIFVDACRTENYCHDVSLLQFWILSRFFLLLDESFLTSLHEFKDKMEHTQGGIDCISEPARTSATTTPTTRVRIYETMSAAKQNLILSFVLATGRD